MNEEPTELPETNAGAGRVFAMKIIVMGTGPFAVPSLRWIAESQHEISLIVTRPIDDAGRRRKTAANPVSDFAESLKKVQVFRPANINDADAIDRLQSHAADLLFVCDYGQILKTRTLATTRWGGINLHGSLLPKYRGAAPINWAIYHGESITGVTVIHMTPKLDGGPTVAKRSIEIGDHETAEQLEPRMAELGVAAVVETIGKLENWDGLKSLGEMQDPAEVTIAPRLLKRQGQIDWNQTARQLFNQIRAFQPWPGSFTHWLPDGGKPARLIIHGASMDESTVSEPPGTVIDASNEVISIATGQGVLRVLEVQPAGKKPMSVGEFLRGRPVKAGHRFGDLPA